MPLDVVVIGQGATGSAALYHLARRGARVAGIERFAPGHDRGSSHGRTRIIRVGYFEHPSYVPLVRRAYGMWRDLEDACGQSLLHVTGIAEIGPPGGVLVQGTLASSRLNDLPHQVFDAQELMRRYPAFNVPDDFVTVMQPEGGYLEAEPAVCAHAALAVSAGAQLRDNERVLAIEPRGGGVRVRTDRGMIEAGIAVIAAGPSRFHLAFAGDTSGGHMGRAAQSRSVCARAFSGFLCWKAPRASITACHCMQKMG
jgi:sarcosine oxidase